MSTDEAKARFTYARPYLQVDPAGRAWVPKTGDPRRVLGGEGTRAMRSYW